MKYNQLIERVSQLSTVHPIIVRKVLYSLADALVSLTLGEQVRTPLGAFRMTQRKSRTVTVPQQKQEGEAPKPEKTAAVPAQFVVKMRASSRLRKPVTTDP